MKLIFILFFLFQLVSSSAPTIEQQCNNEFTKVGVCINYASGKADLPSKECCSTVKEIRDSNLVCLCYVIQLAHKEESTLKQMDIQEAKLLQLPNACKLNANISDCPKLLNISPTSPDYSIFANTSLPGQSPPKGDKSVHENNSTRLVHDTHFVGLKTTIAVFMVLFC